MKEKEQIKHLDTLDCITSEKSIVLSEMLLPAEYPSTATILKSDFPVFIRIKDFTVDRFHNAMCDGPGVGRLRVC